MFLTLVTFILVLAVLVLAHEAGHFFAARKNGIKVDEFGFGFPPRIFGARRVGGAWRFIWGNGNGAVESENNSTIYSLNWIPLGGFVKIKGEEGSFAEDQDSFANKKAWRRFVVLAAGVFMNIILAAALLAVGYMIGLPQSLDNLGYGAKVRDAKIEIMSVLSASPAHAAGLLPGDEIFRVNGEQILKIADLQNYFGSKENQKVSLQIKRNGETLDKEVLPQQLAETKRGGIGVVLLESAVVSYPWYLAVYQGFAAAFIFTWEVIKAFGVLIWSLISGAGGITENLAGPVGIAVLTGKVAKLGITHLLQFMALLSVNLAVLNFLPFPALDGGRALFLLVEKLRGKPVAKKVENAFHTAGFAVLMVLVLFVTVKDVGRFKDSFLRLWEKMIQ